MFSYDEENLLTIGGEVAAMGNGGKKVRFRGPISVNEVEHRRGELLHEIVVMVGQAYGVGQDARFSLNRSTR